MCKKVTDFINKYDFIPIGKFHLNDNLVEFSTNNMDKDIVYLWATETSNEIVYVGETKGTFKSRGHLGTCTKKTKKGFKGAIGSLDNISNDIIKDKQGKYYRGLSVLLKEDIVVYIKSASTLNIMGKDISLRHAEELAIDNIFEPRLNHRKKKA
jgi:hypothetical protein